MKRFFAWLLSVLTVISCLNMMVFAQEPTNEKRTETTSAQAVETQTQKEESTIENLIVFTQTPKVKETQQPDIYI